MFGDSYFGGQRFGDAASIVNLAPSGISSAEAFGTTNVARILTVVGIGSSEAFGSIHITETIFGVGGIPGGVVSSNAVLTPKNYINLDQTDSLMGDLLFGGDDVSVKLGHQGIPTSERFGVANIHAVSVLSPVGIPSGEFFGSIVTALANKPGAINSAEAFGNLFIHNAIDTSGKPIGAVADEEEFNTIIRRSGHWSGAVTEDEFVVTIAKAKAISSAIVQPGFTVVVRHHGPQGTPAPSRPTANVVHESKFNVAVQEDEFNEIFIKKDHPVGVIGE